MKKLKSIFCMVLVFCMVMTIVPVSTSDASEQSSEDLFTYVYEQIGNTGAIITAAPGYDVTATVDDGQIAEVFVNGSEITVTGAEGAVGIVTVSVDYGGTESCAIEVPIGYTTFIFEDDELKVFEGTDSNYEITGINTTSEITVTGTANEEDGSTVYSNEGSNTDGHRLLVNIKKKGGTYVFSGTGDDMAIAVNKEASNPAKILLAGLTLKSSFTAPVSVKKNPESTVAITALEGHENLLEDAAFNNADDYGGTSDGGDGSNAEYAESAVIKCKAYANVTINGAGTLALNCNSKNAIKVGEYGALVIDELTLNVDSVKNGISSDNTMDITSGNITVTAEADGIRSDPDFVDADSGCTGNINIAGGVFCIMAGSDGIQAAQDLTITGGDFAIQTGNGYDDKEFDEESMSCKGLKASCNSDETADTSEATNTIEISGGSFYLNTADDAVHSDGYIVITGGVFDIKTGDDGVHADTSLTLGTEGSEDDTAPKITVGYSYEGLEAGNVYIYSGTYKIAAADDGINAAGGSSDDSGFNTRPGDNFNPGGRPGGWGNPTNSGTSTDSYSLNISGGSIYVNADGDGLDSNGALNLTGGTIIVWGAAAGSADEPLDCDGTLLIKGATVFAAGSGSMSTTPSESSQSYVCYGRSGNGMGAGSSFGSSSSISVGKTINVQYNGTTVFNRIAVKNVNYVLYSSADMTSSSNWSIMADDSELLEPDEDDTDSGSEGTGSGIEGTDSGSGGAGTGSGNSDTGNGNSGGSNAGTSSGLNVSDGKDTSATTCPEKGTALTDSKTKSIYIVTKSGSDVMFAGVTDKNITAVKIPARVTLGGVTYNVTAIADKALFGCWKLTSVTIGRNITKIGGSAFQNCKSLSKITIKTKMLKANNVGKKAFAKAGSSNYKKLKVKVPSAKLKLYKKILKKKGLSSKAKVRK